MKKYILSPICSALVIPGMGQILNSQIKKGVVLLASVFLIFISGTIKLALIISSLLNENEIESPDIEVIVQKLQEMDLSSIWLLIILFSIHSSQTNTR